MANFTHEYFVRRLPRVDVGWQMPSGSTIVGAYLSFALLWGLGFILLLAALVVEGSGAFLGISALVCFGLGVWAAAAMDRESKAKRETKKRTEEDKRLKTEARARALRLAQVDNMSGDQFEAFVGELFSYDNRVKKVESLGGPGDMGADIIVHYGGAKTAVQVKRHASSISREAVSEVVTAADYYGCETASVVASALFTPDARQMATGLQVKLVDRDALADWIIREAKPLLAKLTLHQVRQLSGEDFEWLIQRLLLTQDWEDVEARGGPGDLGADLLAYRGGYTAVVQAKRYTGSVSRKAVSDVVAAKKYHGADRAIVVSTGTYTSDARQLATAVGCELIGQADLTEWLRNFPSPSS